MKQIRILAAVVLIFAFSLTSCESFFDVNFDDQATLEKTFSQSSTTKKFLSHLYSYIPMEEEIVNSHGWVVPRSDEGQYSFYQWVYYLLYKTGSYSSATPTSTTITIIGRSSISASTSVRSSSTTWISTKGILLK